uniref:Uncharacterized protein n=1 Tax=viral metagenome TaxID=1070528 RepID=A0A6C0DAP1_9ZZZZ
MGLCFSKNNKKLALKFPHGLSYIEYDGKKSFIKKDNINNFLKNIYLYSKWNNWIVYNDENNQHTRKGHCKGIIAWNKNKISWLCHSVPKFPNIFSGNTISDIEDSELIYGQSFQYIEFDYNAIMIKNIMKQLDIMNANVYINNSDYKYKHVEEINVSKLIINNNIIHIAKSPNLEIDIYGDYIVKEYNYKWFVETWIRGHHINNHKVIDIKNLKFDNIEYTESQDHSKWAVSNNEYYFIGDLNRMTSQYKRGGGGFICKDIQIVNALNSLIYKS